MEVIVRIFVRIWGIHKYLGTHEFKKVLTSTEKALHGLFHITASIMSTQLTKVSYNKNVSLSR